MTRIFTYSTSLCLALTVGTAAAQRGRPVADTVRRLTTRELGEVSVQGRYFRKYSPKEVSPTLRVSTPLLELSQNIQEVPKDILTDQQVLNINESVTRNVSGATRNNISDNFSPKIVFRGAMVNTLRDGVDITPLNTGPIAEDAAIIERVEFIKGPAGFMTSVGDPAGSFNVATKQPTGHNRQTLSATVGSFNLYRGTVDLDGTVGQRGKLQYRFNGVAMKTHSFVQFNYNDKILVAPVLKYQFSDRTSLSAEYIYQKVHFLQFSPTVFSPNGYTSLPRDFTIVDPNLEPFRADDHNAFLTLNHAFSSRWSVVARGSLLDNHTDGRYFFVGSFSKANPNLLQRTITAQEFRNTVYSGQAFVNGNFTTGPVGHRLVAGFDYNRKRYTAINGSSDPNRDKTIYPLDIYNPVYGITFKPYDPVGSLEDRAAIFQTQYYYSGYVQEEANFFGDKLRVTAAGRLTDSKLTTDNRATTLESHNTVFTPRFDLSYSLRPDLSAYAVLDYTFTPQGANIMGVPFDPLRGRNVEVGLKKDWSGGLWNTTLDVYNVHRSNQLVQDPTNLNNQIQIGETVSKGIEFDMKGQVAPGLSVVVNYAYTDSYISSDTNPANLGTPTPYTARHIQNTWVNYALPLRKVKGFSILGGYQYLIDRATRFPVDNPPAIDNLFQLDGGLAWAGKHLTVNALVNNILDKYLYASAWTRPTGLYTWVPLPPRNLRVTVAYTFGSK